MSKAAPGAVYGVILIAVMFLMPSGAGGFLYAMARRLFRSRSAARRAIDGAAMEIKLYRVKRHGI